MGKKTILGIGLILFQIFIMRYGLFTDAEQTDIFLNEEPAFYIGFFIPAIIGVILIFQDYRSKNRI